MAGKTASRLPWKQNAEPMRFWLLATLLFITIVYSTSIQLFWFREHTLDPYYFVNEGFTSTLGKRFSDAGRLSLDQIDFRDENAWKITTFPADSAAYLAQVDDLWAAGPPFRYRLLPALIVRGIAWGIGADAATSYVVMNVLCALVVGIGFTAYLTRWHGFSRPISLLGGVLAVVSLSMMRTLPFPMLEPLSMVASLFVFWSLRYENPAPFLVASVLAVLTKEVFVFAAPLWLIHSAVRRPIISMVNLRAVAVASVPVLVFVGVRCAMGGHPLEVDYGYDLLAGQMPHYGRRLLSPYRLISFFKSVFLGFGAIWLGIVAARGDIFLKRSLLIAAPLVILATGIFSEHCVRPIGVLYPILIPCFLLLMFSALPQPEESCQLEKGQENLHE